ncbi:MAG: murein biosynthesis integral membrane protein MurJ, partial [Candidatus Omnitrophica bacterium]|nr:murein biosynthesis integral membrane protein MurJ [Candidatus Omnitrophota bacterium]
MGTNTKIAKSAGIISLGTVISRILGFVRDVVIARFFGTAIYAQAFVVSFRIPNLLRDLVAEGATNAAVVPVLSEYQTRHTDKDFWHLVNSIFKVISIILTFVTILGILLSPFIVRIIAPGFIKEPEKLKITIMLTKILFPFIFFMGLVAFTTGVLNTRKHFALPSFGQGIINISMVAGTVFFFRLLERPIYGLAFGVLLGGLIQSFLQSILLIKEGMRLEFNSLNIPFEARRMGILLIPRLIGSCIYQLNVFIDTMLASLSSIVGEGGVAALYYSNRLIQFPLAIFGISLAQAALPTMSAQAASNNIDELRKTLSFSLRQIFLVMLPSSVGLMVLGRPIIQILFERGEFNAYSTSIT